MNEEPFAVRVAKEAAAVVVIAPAAVTFTFCVPPKVPRARLLVELLSEMVPEPVPVS